MRDSSAGGSKHGAAWAHLLQPEANHKPWPPSCGSSTWEGNTARLKQSAKRAGGGTQGMATAILMPLEAAVQYEKKMKAVREGRVTVTLTPR